MTQKLLEQLDNENLVKSREISRIWKTSLDNDKLVWTRIIREYFGQDGEFKKSWDMVLSKIPFEIVKELALATMLFFKKDNMFKSFPIEPLHISAFHGNVFLYKYVTEKTGQINLKNNFGETPLHYAAQGGNLEVFKLIF